MPRERRGRRPGERRGSAAGAAGGVGRGSGRGGGRGVASAGGAGDGSGCGAASAGGAGAGSGAGVVVGAAGVCVGPGSAACGVASAGGVGLSFVGEPRLAGWDRPGPGLQASGRPWAAWAWTRQAAGGHAAIDRRDRRVAGLGSGVGGGRVVGAGRVGVGATAGGAGAVGGGRRDRDVGHGGGDVGHRGGPRWWVVGAGSVGLGGQRARHPGHRGAAGRLGRRGRACSVAPDEPEGPGVAASGPEPGDGQGAARSARPGRPIVGPPAIVVGCAASEGRPAG